MGNAVSQSKINKEDQNESDLNVNMDSKEESSVDSTNIQPICGNPESLDEFKKQLEIKKNARKEAISSLKNEIESLREQLQNERKNNSSSELRKELGKAHHDLQIANAEILSLTEELDVVKNHVVSLKEVQIVSKQMMEIREDQVTQVNI